jgi:CBS domain-containing protein
MKVSDLMTRDPACCTPATTVRDVARMMLEHDCGEIPVVQSMSDRRLVGVITDRDIVCRAVAQGKGPTEATAGDSMSQPVVTVTPETDFEECLRVMEGRQIRRMPVVDSRGFVCGIVSQADIASRASAKKTAELVQEVSRPAPANA